MADTITILHSPVNGPGSGETFYYKGAVNPANELLAGHFTDTTKTVVTGEKVYGRPAGGTGPTPTPDATALALFQKHVDRINRAFIDRRNAQIATDPTQAWWDDLQAKAWAERADHSTFIVFACPKTVA